MSRSIPRTFATRCRRLRARRIPPIPGIWGGWRLFPAYSPDAVQSDLGRLQSLYISKGYLDVSLRLDDIRVTHGDANVTVRVDAGSRYRVSGASIDGVAANVGSPGELCPGLFAARREAEKQGIADFAVRLDARGLEPGDSTSVDLAAMIDRGPVYHIGRIEFVGRQHYSDA